MKIFVTNKKLEQEKQIAVYAALKAEKMARDLMDEAKRVDGLAEKFKSAFPIGYFVTYQKAKGVIIKNDFYHTPIGTPCATTYSQYSFAPVFASRGATVERYDEEKRAFDTFFIPIDALDYLSHFKVEPPPSSK